MLGLRRAAAALLATLTLLGAVLARAQAIAALTYARGIGVEGCPDETAFRAAVRIA